MKKLLLEKELKQIRLLMNYDPKETLTENEIPKLENEGTYYYGTLDMTNTTNGSFKNKNMFPDGPSNLYIVSGSKNFPSNRLSITKSKVETKVIPGDTTEPEPKKPVPFDYKLQVEDPFKFDKDELTPDGLAKINDFAQLIFSVAEKSGSPEGAEAYYSFLKNTTIPVYAFSSIDALSNFKDGGTLPACSQYGVGKGPRWEYNLCLSQKRADKIVEILKSKGGILSELKYNPKGMGETNRYSKIVWDDSKMVNPSKDKKNPSGSEKTKPDRRFIVNFPKFDYIPGTTVTPPDSETPGYTEIKRIEPGKISLCYDWLVQIGAVDEEDPNTTKGPNGEVLDERRRPLFPNLKTQQINNLMSEKGIVWDPNIPGCGGKNLGNFKYLDNPFPDNWMIGKDLGLGGDLKVPVRFETNGSLILVDKSKVKEILGPEYDNYFYDQKIDNSPTATLNQNGITIQSSEQTITFGPWQNPVDTEMGQFKETPFKFSLDEKDFEVGIEGAKYKPSAVKYFKFGLSKTPN
jgi:outer membrane protein OmpA-like peptidoglycan-associated protein